MQLSTPDNGAHDQDLEEKADLDEAVGRNLLALCLDLAGGVVHVFWHLCHSDLVGQYYYKPGVVAMPRKTMVRPSRAGTPKLTTCLERKRACSGGSRRRLVGPCN